MICRGVANMCLESENLHSDSVGLDPLSLRPERLIE